MSTLYRFLDHDDELLYIGIAEDAVRRFRQHAADKIWWSEVATIRVEHVADRAEARQRERDAIAAEAPRYNHYLNLQRRPPAPSPAADELTIEHVAWMLTMSPGALLRLINRGGGPSLFVKQNKVLFLRAEVERWIDDIPTFDPNDPFPQRAEKAPARWWSTTRVALELGVSGSTIAKMDTDGRLRCHHWERRARLYEPSAVLAYRRKLDRS